MKINLSTTSSWLGGNSVLTIDDKVGITPVEIVKNDKSIMVIFTDSYFADAELAIKRAFQQLRELHPNTKATMRGNSIVIPKDEIESFVENGNEKPIEGADAKPMKLTIEGSDKDDAPCTVKINGTNYFTLVHFKEAKDNVYLRCIGLLSNAKDVATEGIAKLREVYPKMKVKRDGDTVVIPKDIVESIVRK